MKAAILRAAGVLVCAALAASDAAAGTISISVTTSAEIRDGVLTVALQVTNSGDEAATAVTPVLRFRDEVVRGTKSARLAPGGSLEETLAAPAAGLGEGRWPFQVAVSYTDANQYPFEALHAGTIEVGSPPPARVAVAGFGEASVLDSGELEVLVKNLSDAPRSVRMSVIAPGALEVGRFEGALALAPWEEKPVTVRLTNRAALAGSRYPIFVALEYDDGSVHQTLVARSEVDVLGEEERLGRVGQPLWIAAAFFGLIFLGLLLFRLVRR